MSTSHSKITVDHRGLQAIVRERGEVTLLDELVQNALDTDATEITITITSPANNRVRIVVVDNDPIGYVDLSHAYTLFAPSVKRDDASKRGSMNVGDKLAVAYAVEGRITSTSGSVVIKGDERTSGRTKTDVGSSVDLTFPMSKATMGQLIARARTYLIPGGVLVTVNGESLRPSIPVDATKAKLGLYVAEDDGDMRVRDRVTQLDLYEPDVHGSWIYVLGIPVEQIEGLPRSVNVLGRLKADVKRDTVPPRELHRIKVAVADALANALTHEDVTGWARSTMADASPAVVQRIVEETYGANAMVGNPSDVQANVRATEEGRTLIPTRAFAAVEWDRVRELRAIDPTFAPTTSSEYGGTSSGVLSEVIPKAEWTPDAKAVVDYAHELFAHLFPGCTLEVTIYGGKSADCIAAMGRDGNVGKLALNQGDVGWDWFESHNIQEIVDTLIHEYGHFQAPGCSHAPAWGNACAQVGARLALWGKLP